MLHARTAKWLVSGFALSASAGAVTACAAGSKRPAQNASTPPINAAVSRAISAHTYNPGADDWLPRATKEVGR